MPKYEVTADCGGGHVLRKEVSIKAATWDAMDIWEQEEWLEIHAQDLVLEHIKTGYKEITA